MIEISGEYAKAKVMASHIEKTAIAQVEEFCNQPWTKKTIRIMPDCHAGKRCVIGLTIPIKETVVSNLVGVDIGCGMEVIKVANKELNYKKTRQSNNK